MAINIAQASLKAAGYPTTRTFGDRLADVINVLDYNADNTNSRDTTADVQAALDEAFGSAASPHGVSGKLQNRPVYFPQGQYRITSPLLLTKVVGGVIFGAGPQATEIMYQGAHPGGATVSPLFRTNGCYGLVMERLSLVISVAAADNATAIDLDWNGDTNNSMGLSNNVFRNMMMQGSNGVIIAKSNNQGMNNLFQNVTISTCQISAIDVRGTQAINNMTIGAGGASNAIYAWAHGGSIHVMQPSTAGNGVDLQVDSNYPSTLVGVRSEGPVALRANNGLVTVRGMCLSGGGTFTGSVSGTTLTATSQHGITAGQYLTGPGIANGTKIVSGVGNVWTISAPHTIASTTLRSLICVAEVNGGKVTMDGVFANSGLFAGTGGTLYLRGTSIDSGPDRFTNYSGTVQQDI